MTAPAAAQPIRTRWTSISARKLNTIGRPYMATWIGLPAVFTTYQGERLPGTITEFNRDGYPVISFPDGRHARLDLQVEIIIEPPKEA